MNYYLWIAGKEHGPYTVEQVKEAVLEGTVTIHQTARREDSHDWVPIGSLIEFPPEVKESAAHLESPVTTSLTKRDVREYLDHIRENSCYGVLRSIIEVFAALAIVSAILAIGVGVFNLIKRDFPMGLYCVGSGVAGLILVIGLRQSACLLIDIADTLLHEHSKGRHS